MNIGHGPGLLKPTAPSGEGRPSAAPREDGATTFQLAEPAPSPGRPSAPPQARTPAKPNDANRADPSRDAEEGAARPESLHAVHPRRSVLHDDTPSRESSAPDAAPAPASTACVTPGALDTAAPDDGAFDRPADDAALPDRMLALLGATTLPAPPGPPAGPAGAGIAPAGFAARAANVRALGDVPSALPSIARPTADAVNAGVPASPADATALPAASVPLSVASSLVANAAPRNAAAPASQPDPVPQPLPSTPVAGAPSAFLSDLLGGPPMPVGAGADTAAPLPGAASAAPAASPPVASTAAGVVHAPIAAATGSAPFFVPAATPGDARNMDATRPGAVGGPAFDAGPADRDAPATGAVDASPTPFLLAPREAPGPHAPRLVAVPASTPLPLDVDLDEGLASRITWMADQRMDRAEIRVSPEGLGTIDIRLQLDGGRVHAQFQAAHADVRQALESGMDRLRDLLGRQGMELGQAQVGSGRADDGRSGRPPLRGDATPGEAGAEPAATSIRVIRARGLLDEYA